MELGCFTFLLFILVIVAIVLATNASRRASGLNAEIAQLRAAIDVLSRRVSELRKAGVSESTAEVPLPPQSEPAPQPAPEPIREPEPAPPPVPETPPIPETPTPVPPEVEPEPVREPETEIPPFEEPPPPPPPSRPAPPPRPAFDWESLIGVKLFSWITGIALVLAAVFFLRYSVEHGWLSPIVRASLGILTGSVLLVVCELRIARDYKFTANALHGAGIAILYSTLFATHALWHLLPSLVVGVLMLMVTAVAVLLAIRRDSIFIALLGLVGGFATPAMLSTGENNPIGLFGYLLLLNLGLAWVAHKKRWPVLTACSVAFSVLWQWLWIWKFLDVAQLPLAFGIFVVFALMAASAMFFARRDDHLQIVFDRFAKAGVAFPLFFAVYAVVVPPYAEHYNFLFGFLLLVCAGLAFIAYFRGPLALHMLGAVTSVLIFLAWCFQDGSWPAGLWWAAGFVAFFLVAGIWIRTRAVYAAAALLFLVPFYSGKPGALTFIVAFLLLAAIAAYAIYFRRGGLYYLASFFVIAAEAVWSLDRLDETRLIPALTLYGVFALFFLGVPMIARRFGRPLAPRNGVAVLLLLSLALLFFLSIGAIANAALWGLALLLAVVNIGALMESRTGSNPLLSILAIVLSWIVIGVWWTSATVVANLIPSMVVLGGFGLLVVAGNLWARRGSADAAEFERGTYLGLAGHVFLAFVASQTQLAFPPWPMFAVLLVLDLAIGVAALWLRRTSLLTAAMGASQLVLMIWATHTRVAPWPLVAFGAALAVALFALIWMRLDRRFVTPAVVALILGQIVVVIAGATSADVLFAPLLATHLIFLALLLAVAWITRQHELALVAVVTTTIGTALARTDTPGHELAFAGAIYAFFILFPLLLGERAKRSLYAHLAAVVASAPFFYFARDAMKHAGLDWMIGALPVLQAILLLILFADYLRRLERAPSIAARPQNEITRLALLAGAALMFITVAIPLQLDKQWITIGWALEGAALTWLFTRIPHRGLLLWAGGLLGAVFVRLIFNPAVLTYHAASHAPVFNWYLYTYLVAAASFFIAAYFAPRNLAKVPAILNAGGTILLFALLNIEIADFYSTGTTLTFNFFSSSLAEDLTYTIGWALFAVGMLVAGIVRHTRSARIAAIVLLLVTILKCFLHDLGRLGGLYRVGSLLGLAVSLVFVTILLQKFVMLKKTAPPPEEPAAP
ncbi:MAG: DUF2339 domain-containing protein [Acidobacteria bacterium]|nr:DUF2339 domain-containing protein [Acidobacteriota bacterium]